MAIKQQIGDNMVGLTRIDMPFIVNEWKNKSARNVDFRIITEKRHKGTADRQHIAFFDAYIPKEEIVTLDSFDKKLLRELGYGSIEHYLEEPFNKGLKMSDAKKILTFEDIKINWDIVHQIAPLVDWGAVYDRYKRWCGGY